MKRKDGTRISALILALLLVVSLSVLAVFTLGFAAEAIPGGQDKTTAEKDKKQDRKEYSAEYVKALETRAEGLDKREANILKREQEISFLEQDLIKKIKDFEKRQEEFETAKDTYIKRRNREEKERTGARVMQIASAFKNIKANVAAAQLSALYQENRATALYVMSQIDARVFGKIFSKMTDHVLAARMMEDLKTWRVSEETEDIIAAQ